MNSKLFFFIFINIQYLVADISSYESFGSKTTSWKYLLKNDEKLLKKYSDRLEKLKSLDNKSLGIPKKIHFIWIGSKNFPIESLTNVQSWIDLHPDWEFYFWTDKKRFVPIQNMILRDIKEINFKGLKACYEDSKNYAEKADILRYLILSYEGGIYVDHDVLCLRNFSDLINKYDFFAGLETPHKPIDGHSLTVGNAVVGVIPNHPLILSLIDYVQANWKSTSERFTGNDPISNYELVMHRTYIPMTKVCENMIFDSGFKNVVFPANYFFSIENMDAVYAKHLFANTWYFDGENNKHKNNLILLDQEKKDLSNLFKIYCIAFISLFLALSIIKILVKKCCR